MALSLYHHLLFFFLLCLHAHQCPAAGGSWSVLLPSIGISAMHMQLLPNDRVVMYDRTDFGISNISLPEGICRPNSTDCSAHSVEYDVASNSWPTKELPKHRICSTTPYVKGETVNEVEVLVCGGAPKGAFVNANKGIFDGALDTCGRIKISDPNPQWFMETMPLARVMGDMLLLPNGHVLIINGASAGVAGWELGRNPVLSPVAYRPDNQQGSRFEVQNPSTIPRVYHSTAVLLRDGRVLVGGSNPHDKYEFANVLYPTELSLETFSPSYLDSKSSGLRPRIILPVTNSRIRYGKQLVIVFTVSGVVDPSSVSVTMVAPSFNTHSFSMNQRLLVLDGGVASKIIGRSRYQVVVRAPPSGNIAPAGNYLLFVVHKEISSPGIWVQMQ
ncbi:hypothetical protein L1987_44733 [Smallanthus sonchifolius]|uniref:Uncharacterized protein n=1 Tax=Smallanthus sonchifolius TaxID=185202 RepID=A0ACB9GQ29_9ASTR|nr:hypothetical protein L1987_44733 [Smallanthus sonchifolius]